MDSIHIDAAVIAKMAGERTGITWNSLTQGMKEKICSEVKSCVKSCPSCTVSRNDKVISSLEGGYYYTASLCSKHILEAYCKLSPLTKDIFVAKCLEGIIGLGGSTYDSQ